MARRSSTQIDKRMAKGIAKKLEAKIVESSDAHNRALIFHNDILVADFGIRRGSRKGAGHDHIPRDLKVGPRFAKDLANCPKSRQDWIDQMIADGNIDSPS